MWAVSLVGALALAQEFKVYPEAKPETPPDSEQTREAAKMMPAGMHQTIYLTDDSYDKVVAFYKGIGKESTMPYMNKTTNCRMAKSCNRPILFSMACQDWRIQKTGQKCSGRTSGGDSKGGTPEYKDIRDGTAIVFVEKR